MERTGLGVSMRGIGSLLTEVVGERIEALLNEVRCLVEVSA
jgi:hypothetical protein